MSKFERELYKKYTNLDKELNALKQNIIDYEIKICNRLLQKILGIKLDLKPYLTPESLLSTPFCGLSELFRYIKKNPLLPTHSYKEKGLIKYTHQLILKEIKSSLGMNPFDKDHFSLYKGHVESEDIEMKNYATALLKALKSSSKVKTEIDKHYYKFTLKPSKDRNESKAIK